MDPISSHSNQRIWDVRPQDFNVGDLHSDPAIKDQIKSLEEPKKSEVRKLLTEIGRDILNKDYPEAKNQLLNLYNNYSTNLETAVENVLAANLPANIYAQVNVSGSGNPPPPPPPPPDS